MTEYDDLFMFHVKNINQINIESRPEEELGVDWEIHSDTVKFGDVIWTDASPVQIDELIAALVNLKSQGATHVACDWHCDHQELEVCGVHYRLATSDERQAYVDRMLTNKKVEKESEIKKLEDRLNKLKGEN